MKSFTLFVICCLVFQFLNSQPVKNAVYGQLGANALLAAINYERDSIFHTGLAAHIGTGFYGVHTTYLTLPVGLKYFIKRKKKNAYFILGIGTTYSKADAKFYVIVDHKEPLLKNTNYFSWIPSLEGRSYTKKNWMFSWIASPVFNHNGFIPLLGLSVGKGF